MRHLASIQTVTKIEPIQGADNIELAHVLGWQCVIKKGEFQPGSKAVYFEIDSFLPIKPEFEFLRKSSFKNSPILGEGFRLRTVQMCGQISQGLLLPLEILPDGNYSVGDDVTDILGVRKWEIPEKASGVGTCIGNLPHFVRKTEEARIQAFPGLLYEMQHKPYYITTKMDGSSFTVAIDANNEVHICSHNYELRKDDSCPFWKHVQQFVENMLSYKANKNYTTLVIQGEFCGEGIQGNRQKLRKLEWDVFNVIADGKFGGNFEIVEAIVKMGLDHVPFEEGGNSFDYETVDELLKRAVGEYMTTGVQKEGIVVRPTFSCISKILNAPLSFKVINNNYLLKEK